VSDARLDQLAALTRRQAELTVQIQAVAVERRALLRDLIAAGFSKRRLADVMGLDRNRIYQLLREGSTPK
jgi:hypothetical protein